MIEERKCARRVPSCFVGTWLSLCLGFKTQLGFSRAFTEFPMQLSFIHSGFPNKLASVRAPMECVRLCQLLDASVNHSKFTFLTSPYSKCLIETFSERSRKLAAQRLSQRINPGMIFHRQNLVQLNPSKIKTVAVQLPLIWFYFQCASFP